MLEGCRRALLEGHASQIVTGSTFFPAGHMRCAMYSTMQAHVRRLAPPPPPEPHDDDAHLLDNF